MKRTFYYLFAFLCFVSCTPRNLAYFSDLQEVSEYTEPIQNSSVAKIQPDDLLSISITSPSPEANAQFNRGENMTPGTISNYNISSGTTNNLYREGYLVDENGFINFPVLGKVQLAGLTRNQAIEKFAAELQPHLKEPIINIRFLNYKITVVGEVNRPATFTIPTQKINILEALGMAGDMTAFGKRENVLVIREEDGVRKMTRLDLNKKDVLNSPYFYLQQNDVVYVEPDKMKQVQASTNTRTISIIASVTSLLIVVATRLF